MAAPLVHQTHSSELELYTAEGNYLRTMTDLRKKFIRIMEEVTTL